jgi:glycosyltransferase involved in cell wall biosynthesis
MNRILVVIPSYNCAPQIGRVISQFNQKSSKYFTKVVVINNCSTDGTDAAAIKAFQHNPYLSGAVYTNRENLGYGGSLKVGFNMGFEGKYDYVLVLHGDDQGHINDIIPYIEDRSYHKYDCTLGARFHPDSMLENYSAFRTFGNKVFNTLFGIVLRKKIFDLGSGLNLYRLSAFSDKEFLNFPDNLTFDYCGIIAHCFKHRNIRFVPITWREDDQISNIKMLRQAIDSLKLLLSFAIRPKVFIEKPKMKCTGMIYSSSLVYQQEHTLVEEDKKNDRNS